jgi:hypothetical protein
VGFHIRRQIREGIGVAVTSLATTGSRVFQSRVYPLQTAELPGLLIFSNDEDVAVETIHGPRLLHRNVRVQVVAVAKAALDVDDTLDQICMEVETALTDPVATLASIAKSIVLVSTAFELEGSAEKPTGSATMTFDVEYYNLENAPDLAQ